jgi:hypothetical protein
VILGIKEKFFSPFPGKAPEFATNAELELKNQVEAYYTYESGVAAGTNDWPLLLMEKS